MSFGRNFWWIIQNLLFILSFIFLFIIPDYFCWNGLGYLFGFDYISYGLILLSIWIHHRDAELSKFLFAQFVLVLLFPWSALGDKEIGFFLSNKISRRD